MKTSNLQPARAADITRGRVAPRRAASTGLVTLTDGVTEVSPTQEIELVGLSLTDLDDGRARITAGGASGGGTDGSGVSGVAIGMLNNSGVDLLAYSTVVIDDTADRAVTTTTTEADTRIVGVVQAPIAADEVGPVLFNGYSAGLITEAAVTRGDYAQTSTTAAAAQATADREAGSFGVILSDTGAGSIVTDSATTSDADLGTSLAVTMPDSVGDGTATGRLLFLSLHLEASSSAAVTPTGWTRIGSTTDYWYYYRICAGADTASFTWTGASLAVAHVLVLDERVSIADPLEDQDFDSTTAAAGVVGLSDAPRYAIAGVDAVGTDPSPFTSLVEGSAGSAPSEALTIVQQTALSSDETNGVSFPAAVTVGNMLVWVCWRRVGTGTAQPDCRKLGTGSDPDLTYTYTQVKATPADTNGMALGYKIADSTSQGPFKSMTAVDSSVSRWMLYEIANAGTVAVLSLDDQVAGTSYDVGDFTTTTDDLVFMGTVWKSGTDPAVTVGDWAQEVDSQNPFGHPWAWLGRQAGNGGTVEAKFTASSTSRWGAIAFHLSPGSNYAAGTLAGKYIGRVATIDSPFTGASEQNDALIVLNMTTDALPSVLLYGPDLATPLSDPGVSGAGLFWDGDSWEPAYAPEPLILEDGTIAVLENGSAAMSEPTFI